MSSNDNAVERNLKTLSNWAVALSKQRYILIVRSLLNFRREVGNLCAISSKGKER